MPPCLIQTGSDHSPYGLSVYTRKFPLSEVLVVQRLGPRPGVAPGQPHDAGRTARTGQGGPLVGGPHLPRGGAERHRLGPLLRLPDPRTARLTRR